VECPELAAVYAGLNIIAAPEFPEAYRKLRLNSFLTLILSELILRGYRQEQNPVSKEQFQREVVIAIKTHLSHSLGKGENLETLARLAGYSKYHFFRLFRRHTGHKLQDYIDLCRRKRTEEMLAAGASHKEVSFQLGFSAPTSFSRWYRKNYS
jgi:transcriptional regulator GlxA family with amidase domain